MKRDSGSAVGFYTMGVACLFLAVFFLTVVFGAQTYRKIVAGQTGNNETRALLSYLTTCLKSNDTEGAVRIYEEEGRLVLSIADGGSGYGLRLYRYEGSLLEDYGKLESALNPSAAQVIGETEVFLAEEVDEHTYAVTTDEGRVVFHSRCGDAMATEAVEDE